VVAAVLERGAAVLGAEAGLVALLGGEGEGAYLEITAARGYEDDVVGSWSRFPVAASLPLSDAVREREPIFSASRADMEARYPEMFRQGPTHAVKASASLPLLARGRAIGGLHFSFPSERAAFAEADRAFLLELARQCALALDRALLLEEQEVARRRQEFLVRASALLAESLDYQTTLDAITRLAVPDLCDWASVDLVNPDDEGGALLQLAVAHQDPAEVAWVREAQRRYPIRMDQPGQPVVQVITTGQTLFLPEIPDEVLIAASQDEEQLRLIRKLALRSFLCVPLSARGRTLGTVTFCATRSSGRVFTPETVSLVEELARRAAVAVDNAWLYRQSQAARRRQEFLSRASALLGESLDYHTTLDSVARLAVPGLCDWVTVDFVGEPAAEGETPPLDLAVVAHTDPAAVESLRALRRSSPIDMSQAGQPPVAAILTGETVRMPEITPEMIAAAARNEEQLRHMERLAVRALVSVPLRTAGVGAPTGAVTLALTRASGRTLTPETVALAEEMAQRAAVAIDKARLYEEARTARRQTESVLDSIDEMFYAVDDGFRFTYANRRAEAFWGRPKEDLLGRTLWEAFPAVVGTHSERELTRALRERRAVTFEVRSALSGRWVECSAYPAEDGGLAVYFRDIHDQKTAREEIARREREYAAVAENADDVMARFDRDLRFLYANRAIERHIGVPPAALVGRTLAELGFPEEKREHWTAAIRAVFATGERRVIRFDFDSPSLGPRWYEASITPERTAGIGMGADRLETVIVVARDITDDRAAEEALRQEEERLRLATAAANVGTWDYRPLTGELVWDARCKELFGLPADTPIEYGVFLAGVHEDDRERMDAAVRRSLTPAGGGEIAEEFRTVGLADGGRVRWVATRGKAFFRERDGAAERLVGTLVDITDAKEREDERRAMAQKQRRFLKEMLAGFTEGRLRLCFTREELPAPLAPLSEPLELSDTALRLLRKRLEAVGEGLKLPKDRLQGFATAVHEAAVNAVKYGGGGTARVHGDPEMGTVQVWVEDRGPGIAEEMIHRAVEQGYTTAGFGHGMFFMQSCADRVYLYSRSGEGTSVVLEMDWVAPEPAWLRASR
jgi:PAS domain S-box-containing protein